LKNILSVLLFIPILLFAQTSEKASITSPLIIINNFNEDERALLTIDSLERADEFPDKLKISGQNAQYRLPKKGMDYVFVYFKFNEKVDLRIGLSEMRLTKSNVLGDNNKYYSAIEQRFESAFGSNKRGFIIFELPKGVNPTELSYFYQYRNDIKPKRKIKLGQINVSLINSN